MNNTKLDSYIGFAVRSNKVIFGVDRLLESKKIPLVVMYDEELGANSLKHIKLYCERKSVTNYSMPHGYLANLLKREKVKVISIIDVSLGSAIIKDLDSKQEVYKTEDMKSVEINIDDNDENVDMTK